MTNQIDVVFGKVAIIGPGLIGSSFAHAIREAGVAQHIIGYDQDPAITKRAEEIGVIDAAAPEFSAAVKNTPLIILSTPVGAISKLCEALNAHATSGAIIIDVGSVKGSIVKAAETLREDLYFIPCHPVAGTEQSGPEAGFASLFHDRWCILTPLSRHDDAYKNAVETVSAVWKAVGANVEIMDAEHHDLALAVTSHLPHLIAFTLVGAADDIQSVAQNEVVKYSAGGFRDFTRIAASDPVMWRDVFLENKDAVLEVLGRFSEELAVMQRAIRWGDADALYDAFARGRSLRRAIVEAGQETAAPNFGRDEHDESEADS